MSDMDDPPLTGELRFLKRLVTVLTATMIGGLVVIIALLVIRLGGTPPARPVPAALALPASIRLPDGARAVSFTQGYDWFGVVTDRQELLIFDPETGAIRQRIAINPG